MGHAKTFKNAAPGKKEKIFHPQSRKADQIARSNLRKDKLAAASSKRNKRDASQVDVYAFYFHALPPEGTLTLPDIHALVQDSWLTRHDAELAEEQKQRRPGRPKSMKEMRLEEIKLREAEEYRSGLEVIDLTHPANVELLRQWDQIEAAYVQMLRFIRINKDDPSVAVVTRPGKHMDINPHVTSTGGQGRKDKAFVPKKRIDGAVTIGIEMDADGDDVPMLIETS